MYQSNSTGKYGKPEFISVVPLTNPNRISDKTIDVSRLQNAGSTNSGNGSIRMQSGGNILSVPSSTLRLDNSDLVNEIRNVGSDIRNLKQALKDMKFLNYTVLDGQVIDQSIQIISLAYKNFDT